MTAPQADPGRRGPLSEETSCNLCGATDYEAVSERDRDGRPLRTTICRRCGLVWTNPRPTLEQLERYYSRAYRADYKKSAAPTARKVLRGFIGALERKRALQPMLRVGSRTLDVGCGAGEFVFVLRASGMDASGVEPDLTFSRFARERLKVPVQTAGVLQADVRFSSLDLVTMFHSLEHVGDPLGMVRAIGAWLRPGGLLVIEVPNVDSRCQAPERRFHYAHLFNFSIGTLQALGGRAGLLTVGSWLSDDAGNITALFRRSYGDHEGKLPSDLGRNYEQTRGVIDAHTRLRHYLSRTPYIRAIRRALRRRRENQLLHRLRDVPRIAEWAAAGGVEEP